MAPSQAFSKLANSLIGSSHQVDTYLSEGKAPFNSTTIELSGVDAVVVGMSSNPAAAQPEIDLATRAKIAGIPVYLYADTFSVHNRPGFGEILPGSTLFHISEAEAVDARSTFPETNVVATGNPMTEGFFFPKYTRDEVRQKLGGHPSFFKWVLCPAGKSMLINLLHFGRVAEEFEGEEDVGVLLSLHPGDKTDPSVYHELCSLSPVPMTIIERTVLSASDMLPAIDMVFDSASTVGVEAACLRIPVVTYLSPMARTRLFKATSKTTWGLCDQWAAYDYHELNSPRSDLLRILRGRVCRDLPSLEKFYPQPARVGVAVEKMMAEITKVPAEA